MAAERGVVRVEDVVSTAMEGDTLGGAIRRLRQERGLTVTELASRAGMEQSSVSRIELGQVVPHHKSVAKLATALGVSVEDLTGRPPAEVPSLFLALWREMRTTEERAELIRALMLSAESHH